MAAWLPGLALLALVAAGCLSLLTYQRIDPAHRGDGTHPTELTNQPDQADLHIRQGDTLLNSGDADGAMTEFRLALAGKLDDHDRAVVHTRLGQLATSQCRFDEAIVEHRAALGLHPDLPDALIHWGIALVNQGDLEGGMEKTRRALEVAPDNAAAHHSLGQMLLAASELAEAVEEFSEAARLEPGNQRYRDDLIKARVKLQGNVDIPSAPRE